MSINSCLKSNKIFELTKIVTKELLTLGYNFKLQGTQYLLESIVYICSKRDMNLLENLEKNVYKYISNKNNKRVSNIKTSIIKSTNYVYDYQDEKKLHNYFSIDIKITPKLVISTVVKKVLLNNKN